MPHATTARGTVKPAPPAFVWADKSILRRIREEVEDYGSALCIYFALCCVASDTERDQFQTTHQWLAHLAGVSVPTVKRRLADLQAAKAVEVQTPAMKAPCAYRLLAPQGHTRTLVQHDLTLAHGTGRAASYIRNNSAAADRKTKQQAQLPEAWVAELQDDPAYRQLSVAVELAKARRWCEVNHRQCTRRFFVSWLNRCRPASPGTARGNRRSDAALLARLSDLRAQLARELDPEAGAKLQAELAQLTRGGQA
ncbi:MAG TPA: hypothetical protein P5205_08275 [Candidatus Paceibacterota bacterium]|nr:hypothetical protein [Verrucomicrobiota bacterium]HSA10355.1 hypothetical protein [Candidatus Paceibacterota bacterium]